MTSKQTHLNKYIQEKHTQEECIGFIDGFDVAMKELQPTINEMVKDVKTLVDENIERKKKIDELIADYQILKDKLAEALGNQ